MFVIRPYYNIGYVTHPQLIGTFHKQLTGQVRIFRQVMSGIRCTGTVGTVAQGQAVFGEDATETVATDSIRLTEGLTVHQP